MNDLPNSPQIEPKGLAPFKKFCMTIGEIPSSYLESMSYAEMTLWLCDYLKNTVIPAVNNNAEAVKELQGLYVELKEYVDNYFTNLDVQEEINNKLDNMAEDGTLTNLIKNYVDPIFNEFEEEINSQISTQNTRIAKIEDDVSNIITITPTVVSSTSEMTDHSKIYVLTTDGYWYYYNGSTFVQGGKYTDTANVENIENINEFLNGCGYLNSITGKYINLSGIETENQNWFCSQEYLPIKCIKSFSVPLWKSASCVAFYDYNKTFISGVQGTGNYTETNEQLTDFNNAPSNAFFVRFSYCTNDNVTYKPIINTDFSIIIKNVQDLENLLNLYDLNNIKENYYINLSGVEAALNNWSIIQDFIPLSAINSLSVPLWKSASCVAFYDYNKRFISGVQGTGNYTETNEELTNFDDAPSNAFFVRFSYTSLNNVVYKPTINLLPFNQILLNLFTDVINLIAQENPWNNKVCAFLGDSMTEGVGTVNGHVYWNYLQNLKGIVPHSYGVNGAKFAGLYQQAQEMKNELQNDVDCIFVFAGTNDFFRKCSNW